MSDHEWGCLSVLLRTVERGLPTTLARNKLLEMLATCNDIYVLFGVLILALKTLDREVIERLLMTRTAASVVVPSYDDRFAWSEIVADEVVSSGYLDVVEWLLKYNRSVDRRRLLCLATKMHRLDMVEAVLEVMPDSDFVVNHVVGPLRFATDHETKKTIELLLRKDKLDASALLDMLSRAVSEEKYESIRTLLAASPLHFAGHVLVGHAHTASIRVAEILVRAGGVSDTHIGKALCTAVSRLNNDIVEYLVERLVERGCDALVATAAECAAAYDNLHAMKVLLRTGRVSDSDVELSLSVAVGNRYNHMVDRIIEHKPGCNKHDAVTRAAACNNLCALNTLLSATLNPGVANAYKSRALYKAVQNRNVACAVRLLDDKLHPASPYANVYTLAKAVEHQDRIMLSILLGDAQNVDEDEKGPAIVNALKKAMKMLRKDECDEAYYDMILSMLATAGGYDCPC